ncbi:hypothetical protein ACHAXT_004295 [Thalassiosira profunda]
MSHPSPPSNGSDLLTRWSDADHWRRLCPHLTILEDALPARSSSGDGCNEATNEKLLTRLVDDGYALLDRPACGDSLREKLARGITDLEEQHSLPATFVLLFDEAWALAAESYKILLQNNISSGNGDEKRSPKQSGILQPHQMAFNFDVLAWHIDPRSGKAGFSPHRDRQPETMDALKDSFYPDGQAKYVTHWVALSDATPENSCLYVIPRQFDPGYTGGDDPPENEGECSKDDSDECSEKEQTISDPLSRALSTKQSYQNIRALPRNAGASVIFTHRILHWGSRGNPEALDVRPRIAISFVYSDVEFEAPYLVGETLAEDGSGKWRCPPFSIRLLMVCAQLLIYYQRFDLPASTLRACYDYCKANADKLHEAYRKKVFFEFVKAMKERMDGSNEGTEENKPAANDVGGGDANSEDEEALLEEMLDNSDAFDDDYDDLCDDEEEKDGGGKRRKLEG